MGFIWDAIAGCSTPGINFVTAIVLFIGHLLSAVVGLVIALLNAVLQITILNTGGVTTARTDLLGGGAVGALGGLYLGMAALGLLIAGVAVVWAVIRHQESLLTGNRMESLRGLLGRALGAVVWIAAVPLALWAMIQVNDVLVNTLAYQLHQVPFQFASSCKPAAAIGYGIASLGTSVITSALIYLFWDVLALALIVGILAALGQYFLRLFQIVFWGALLPVAAGASVADPQRRAWTYVWGQVQGSIFTQAAMAFGIYITEYVLIGGTPGIPFVTAHTTVSAATPNMLLSYMMGVAGFFVVSKIPRYFQEMQGHTVGGGSEMGAIAGGYIMGRFGSQALQATKGGIMMTQGMETRRQQNTYALASGPGIVASHFQRSRQQSYAAQGANTVLDAQDQATAGLTAAQVHAGTVTTQARMDAAAGMPLSRDATSADRALNTDPTIPLNPHPTRGTGGIVATPTPPFGAPGTPPPADPGGPPLVGPPGGFPDSVDAAGVLGAAATVSEAVGVRAASGSVGVRQPAPGARTPTYGPGSHTAVGQPADTFAAAMVPMAQSLLHGDLVTTTRAQAARQGVSPTQFNEWMAHPDQVAPRDRVNHAQVVERAQTLHAWQQQLAINPTATIAQLAQVSPEALADPNQQPQIEAAFHAAIQDRQSPVRTGFLRPVALDHNNDYSIA